ncbi:MAG: TlpA disulfide reductase family protein [Chitinophagaceae bacterium]
MKRLFVLIVSFLLSLICFSQRVGSVKITELETIIAESKTPLIINFWATWCKPCIEEIPYFEDEVKKHRKDSVKLILVSLDFKEAFPQAISAFANKRKIEAPILWLNETNADYFCPKIDAKWSGAIPATLFINNKTGYRNFVEEQISHDQLKNEIKAMLK